MTKRQRLKRDPSNQPKHKFMAWAKGNGVATVGVAALFRPPRIVRWVAGRFHPDTACRRMRRVRSARERHYLSSGTGG